MTQVKEEFKFYLGKKDRMFKAVFFEEKDINLLEYLVYEVTRRKISVEKILPTELLVNNKRERSKTLDGIFTSKNTTYEIEVNSKYDKANKIRNLAYFCSLIGQFTKKGKQFKAEDKFVYIGINSHGSKKEPLNGTYKIYDLVHKIELADNIIFYEINLDKIEEAWNNKDIEIIKKYPILTSLSLNLEELEELVKITGSKEVERIKEKLKKLNSDDVFIAPFSKEEGDEMENNTRVALAKEEGIEQGIEKGIEQGIEQGQSNIIKKLLTKKLSIKEISEMLDMPVNDINKILNN